jgi:hypothetical protein
MQNIVSIVDPNKTVFLYKIIKDLRRQPTPPKRADETFQRAFVVRL